tara:strand:- start:45077 stop:46147 length:1071 start_codon:yes stop_codon:yes gene_type:complete
MRYFTLIALAYMTMSCSATKNIDKRNFELIIQSQDVNRSWPRGFSRPHYVYLGDIYGERNLTEIKQQHEGILSKLWSLLTGNINKEPIALKRPQGIISDKKGMLYISDVSHQGVFAIDTVNGTLKLWKSAGKNTHFNTPIGIALIDDNELLIADAELGYIVRLDVQGKPIGLIKHDSLMRPTGIVFVKEQQLIYVSDTSNDDIKVFNRQGELLRVIGKSINDKLSLNAPTFLAQHPQGLLISDTLSAQVKLIKPNESADALSVIFGKRGMKLGNLTRPKGVASDSAGNVYIIESYFDHLLVFNDKGQFLLPLGGTGYGAGEFYLPSGIWIDDRDRIYIADMMNGRISVFQFLGGNE